MQPKCFSLLKGELTDFHKVSQIQQNIQIKKSKRDRVGINAGHRTEPREGSSSDGRRSSGYAPVKCQQIWSRDEPGPHTSQAEWGAPHQWDGSKEPPPCQRQTTQPSSEC